MRFLVDAQLPPALCRWLEARGHEAVHVAERSGTLTDEAIGQWAEIEKLVLISKDDDFVILRLPNRFKLLWLRCGNASNRALTAWLEVRWSAIEGALRRGEVFVEAR